MKLTTKLLAGALALAAAGVASAQAVTPSPNAATGSDLLFIAFDLNAKTSFVMDLGVTLSAFSSSTTAANGNVWSVLGANSQFASYESASLSAAGATYGYGNNALAGTTWAVVAGQTGSIKNLDITAQNGATVGNSIATKLSPIVGNIGYMVSSSGLNNGIITPTQLQAGYFSSTWDYTNAGFAIGQGDLNYSILNNVGQSANFITYNYTGGTGLTPRTPTTFGGVATPSTFNFDGSNLTYSVAQVAAVPEPSSYAMLLAGLLLVGTMVARRRNSK